MRNLFSRWGSVDGINAKSTALSPILWMFGISFTGIGLLYWTTNNEAVLYFGFFVIGIIGLVALGLTIFFAIKDPDRLQSEKFSIRKLEISQGLLGDNNTGLLEEDSSKIITDAHYETKEGNNV
ncbi:hypothetical protein DDU33_03505 [Actinobacillus porcitonsillarum]|uniref:Uncharacterized protein n=1 Tax=Actinobacillus porcitonsillarum TaxID=189834 RepID=A0A2U8FI36_9PAST|nr:hypothetical protein [Actinobacillus porcitonsillarum]AWI50615.1 hypothetical protein DDU33_03505 [Actinobacillus porcitonsillarum]